MILYYYVNANKSIFLMKSSVRCFILFIYSINDSKTINKYTKVSGLDVYII